MRFLWTILTVIGVAWGQMDRCPEDGRIGGGTALGHGLPDGERLSFYTEGLDKRLINKQGEAWSTQWLERTIVFHADGTFNAIGLRHFGDTVQTSWRGTWSTFQADKGYDLDIIGFGDSDYGVYYVFDRKTGHVCTSKGWVKKVKYP